MLKNRIIFLFSFSLLFSHPVVKNLDIDKFMGRWYVFSLIPNWIESGATNSYDEYTLNKDGTIGITYKAIKNGKERTVKQKGTIVDKKNPVMVGLSTFISFVTIGILPLIPFIMNITDAFRISSVLMILSLFITGMLKSVNHGIKTLILGSAAAFISYKVGEMFRE